MYHDLYRTNLLIGFGYYLFHYFLLPFIGKTLVLLYNIIIYLQEKIILYAKMHNKKHCLYSRLQIKWSVGFQLIFEWNLMLIFYA